MTLYDDVDTLFAHAGDDRDSDTVAAYERLQSTLAQRDELVTALEQIAALAESDSPSRQENVRLVARAILAKVQS